jgi:hypothetical protein
MSGTRPVVALASLAFFASIPCFTGCQNKPAQSNKAPTDSQLAGVPEATTQQQAQPAPPAADSAKAEALAAKINSFAKEMGPILQQRQNPAPTTQPQLHQTEGPLTRGSGEPSQVEFAKPGAPLPQGKPPEVVPVVTPVVDNQPSTANQQISIAANGAQGNAQTTQSPMRVSPEDLNRTASVPRPAPLAADLEARLSRHIQEYPRDTWAHLDFQLLHFLRDEQVPLLDALTSLPLEDRELVAAVMDGLTNFRNALRSDNNMLLSRKVKPLMELADRLRSQADLTIPTLALCTKVDAFGVYEPIEPVRFLAGKEHQAIIYCEVENFASTPMADNKLWETKLTQEAVLYTESGMQVWVDKAGNISDRSRNRRHDFFIVKRISLPSSLTIGRYLLKVTVQDQQARRVAEQTMAVEVVAQLETTAAATGTGTGK